MQKTLQHVLMHTATTAFSEGAKTTFRHMGQAMNERFGPFSSFFTTNFADAYHVLLLHNRRGLALAERLLLLYQLVRRARLDEEPPPRPAAVLLRSERIHDLFKHFGWQPLNHLAGAHSCLVSPINNLLLVDN